MRRVLLALAAIALTIPAAEAAQRDTQRTQVSRAAKPAVQAQRATPPRQATAARQSVRTTPPATRQAAATTRTGRRAVAQGRVPVRPGDVRTSSSSTVVRGASAATISRDAMARQDRGVRGWQSGLLPTSHAQTACPEGTFATLASGHANVVRCMPL